MAAVNARIRAFAGIEIGEATREALAKLLVRLKSMHTRVSWVRAENLHLTLRFLGDIEPDRVEAFAALVRTEAAVLPPFDAAIRGVGVFPNARRPNVIWTGVEDAAESLAATYAIAERAARAIGLAPESRRFLPHVTLGRVRRGSATRDIAAFLERERGFDAGAFTVEAVSLFSSELTSQGARYTRLHRLGLDGISRARHI